MTNVYSAPINDHRAAVPTYPQLADPTVQPPEQPPDTGPTPGGLYSTTGGPAIGAPVTGGSGIRKSSAGGPGGGGTQGGGQVAYPPAAATLQGATSGLASEHVGGQALPD